MKNIGAIKLDDNYEFIWSREGGGEIWGHIQELFGHLMAVKGSGGFWGTNDPKVAAGAATRWLELNGGNVDTKK